MANPNRPPGTTGNPAITGELPPPLDHEELRQIRLLNEAILVSFTATPNPRPPYKPARLAWDITMPTTVIPGVHVEVHLYGDGDQSVQPQGGRDAAPYLDTTYALALRTPLAHRQLGTLDLAVDFATCRSIDLPVSEVYKAIKNEANKPFPPGGKVTLRGDGARVDIGINSFVIDIPLRADVPDWFDADIDVRLGFSVFSIDGRIGASHDLARTEVSFGVASSILSGGCSAAVAAGLEAQSDGYLDGFIGPVIAGRIAAQVQAMVNTLLKQLNDARPPVPYRFQDFTLTDYGITCRFCPVAAPPTTPDHGWGGGVGPAIG